MKIGFKCKYIGNELKELFDFCVYNPDKNQKEFLVKKAEKDFYKINK